MIIIPRHLTLTIIALNLSWARILVINRQDGEKVSFSGYTMELGVAFGDCKILNTEIVTRPSLFEPRVGQVTIISKLSTSLVVRETGE